MMLFRIILTCWCSYAALAEPRVVEGQPFPLEGEPRVWEATDDLGSELFSLGVDAAAYPQVGVLRIQLLDDKQLLVYCRSAEEECESRVDKSQEGLLWEGNMVSLHRYRMEDGKLLIEGMEAWPLTVGDGMSTLSSPDGLRCFVPLTDEGCLPSAREVRTMLALSLVPELPERCSPKPDMVFNERGEAIFKSYPESLILKSSGEALVLNHHIMGKQAYVIMDGMYDQSSVSAEKGTWTQKGRKIELLVGNKKLSRECISLFDVSLLRAPDGKYARLAKPSVRLVSAEEVEKAEKARGHKWGLQPEQGMPLGVTWREKEAPFIVPAEGLAPNSLKGKRVRVYSTAESRKDGGPEDKDFGPLEEPFDEIYDFSGGDHWYEQTREEKECAGIEFSDEYPEGKEKSWTDVNHYECKRDYQKLALNAALIEDREVAIGTMDGSSSARVYLRFRTPTEGEASLLGFANPCVYNITGLKFEVLDAEPAQ